MMFTKEKHMTPIDVLLNHKTIREFKPSRMSPAHLSILIDVAKRTATSLGMQSFSMIRIVNPEVKKQIAQICQQEYVGRLPELFIFLVDCYRNVKIAEEQGESIVNLCDTDRFLQGWTDATLAAQNMAVAAELGGFGTVFLGSILNDAPQLIELLHMPKYTFPVLGLGIGVADQHPQLKPRMPRDMNVFDDTYDVVESYIEALEEYDEEMEEYYDLRDSNHSVGKFTAQIVKHSQKSNMKRKELLKQAKQQGFIFNME